MKKFIYTLVPALALIVSVASCDKTETPEPKTPDPKPSTGPSPYTPSVNNVDGILAAVEMMMTMEQGGFTIPVNSELGFAAFWNTPGTYVDAGTVKLNSIDLELQSGNTYHKLATTGMTPADMDLDNGVAWNVNGGNGVPVITFNHSGNFPEYTGTLPASVSKSGGISFSFTSSSVKNADSVYVVIAGGNEAVTKSFAANAGSVTITASELSALPAVSDNTGLIQVVPVKMQVTSFGSKKYVFVKEQANMRYININ